MPSLLETWTAKISERLWEWQLRIEQARPSSVYTALCAAALWPLVQAAQHEGILPIVLALGNVMAGVGGNLIAEQLQRWHDRANPTSEAEVDAWLQEQVATNTDLRQELDTILEHLQVISQARTHLNTDDRQWFVQTLRTELTAMGNLARFEAHLTGSGAIAQGDHAQAVGAGGTLVGRDVHGDVIAPGGTKIITQSPAEPPTGLREAYLSWVMEQVRTVPLAGVDPKSVREETRRDLELAAVYTALMTQQTETAGTQERLLETIRKPVYTVASRSSGLLAIMKRRASTR
jgi:hypothetical protein